MDYFNDDETYEAWREALLLQLQRTPPRCLSGFRATLLDFVSDDHHLARWNLACQCGESRGSVLGHPLGTVNPQADHLKFLLSPLGFECSRCGVVTSIIDVAQHGYDGEMGHRDRDTQRVGPPSRYACTACSGRHFSMVAGFMHSHFEHLEDYPALTPTAQDYFDGFGLEVECITCGRKGWAATFELA